MHFLYSTAWLFLQCHTFAKQIRSCQNLLFLKVPQDFLLFLPQQSTMASPVEVVSSDLLILSLPTANWFCFLQVYWHPANILRCSVLLFISPPLFLPAMCTSCRSLLYILLTGPSFPPFLICSAYCFLKPLPAPGYALIWFPFLSPVLTLQPSSQLPFLQLSHSRVSS